MPSYIQAKPDAVMRAFGAEVTAKIFSAEFTPLRQEALWRSARTIPGFDCPSDLQVVLFDVVPHPIKPGAVSWIENYFVACAPRARRNFLLLLDGERARIAELLPGLTLTDPALQHDAHHGAKVAVKPLRPETCEKTTLTDTNVTTAPERAGAPWAERWSYDLCGIKAEVELAFTPSARGGTTWTAKLVN